MWLTGRMAVGLALNAVAPGLLDRYLGRTAVGAQQTYARADPDLLTNLWEPVVGDHGAHGGFDDESRVGRPAVRASMHRARPDGEGRGAGYCRQHQPFPADVAPMILRSKLGNNPASIRPGENG